MTSNTESAANKNSRLKGLDENATALTLLLSRLRGETPEQTLQRFGAKKLRKIPGGIRRHTEALLRTEFRATGVEGDRAWAEVPSGRRFYGHPSLRSHRREYTYLADKLHPVVTEETYLICKDVVSRYITDWGWYPRELLPGPGGRVVEVGAYMGHKAMRFVDECVGPTGRVLSLELNEENTRTIALNAEYNGMESVIDTVTTGVFSHEGTQRVISRGRQRNSLVNLDKLDGGIEYYDVPVRTLDSLLEQWSEPVIDFMVVTANGAELEVLRGLDRWFNCVRVMYIAACYTVDGSSTYESCLEYLNSRGCEILPQSSEIVIYAANPRAGALPGGGV